MNSFPIKPRKIAWGIINEFTSKNRQLSTITSKHLQNNDKILNKNDKRFITFLIQGTIRFQGRLDLEIDNVYHGSFMKLNPQLQNLLRLGAFQIRYMDNVPNYAAVTTSVQLAKTFNQRLAGLTNALLRKLIIIEKMEEPTKESSLNELSRYLSHPEWLINKWINDLGFEKAKEIANWNNTTPQTWFRINVLKYSIKEFIKYLNHENINYDIFNDDHSFIKVYETQSILNTKLFKEGKVSVQNPSAGLAVKLLAPKNNDLIIDICAAPGGKTSYISELMNNKGHIIAHDNDVGRLKTLNNTLIRLGVKNTSVEFCDITKSKIKMTSKMLMDVPCSCTGVISKHPDIRWRREMHDILEFHLLQRKILWSASKFIEPGGVLVYSTCSIEPEENWMIIDAFLKKHHNYSIEGAEKYISNKYVDKRGALSIYPPKHKIDGAFAVRLVNNG